MNQELVDQAIKQEQKRMRKVGYSLIVKAINTGKIEDKIQNIYLKGYKDGSIGLDHQLKEIYPIK